MTTKKNLKWRLGKLPTPDEVAMLVRDKIITQEEAREVLFAEENETERDEKSLEAEIKFLRELVERLSKNQQTVITTIREIERPYIRYPWYQPYQQWCLGSNLVGAGSSIVTNAFGYNNATAGSANLQASAQATGASSSTGFSSIKTF